MAPSDNLPRPRPRVPLGPGASPTNNFMKYPYPESKRVMAHIETLPGVTVETKGCIAKLLNYRAVPPSARLPRGPSAAVLVPLFVGRSGNLYVVLSRRSDALRAYAGDTALPGGKVDVEDTTVEDTARREAFEEIGLPEDRSRVPLLCVMEPHLAKGVLLVTPVVVLIIDNTLQPNLNSSEVTSIFAQPLASFLSSTPQLSSGRTADLNEPYHTFTDLSWGDGGTVRLHRFLTGREAEGVKPVFGLTASILIKTATIGYGRSPEFEVQPLNAPTAAQQIARALLTPANPLRVACEREGLDADESAARMLRPLRASNAVRTAREWQKFGIAAWKRFMEGGSGDETDDSSRVEVDPKIMEQVKKRFEAACKADGELDPEALFAMIPKEVREGLKGGIQATKVEVRRGEAIVGSREGRAEGVERGDEGMGRSLEETKKHISKSGDGHGPKRTRLRKHNAKL